MRFEVSPEEIKKANVPHEIFLTNLIGNHILMTAGAGGMAGTFPWIMSVIPIVSFSLLGYIMWRARRSARMDPWYVMCHWQVSARRSSILIPVLSLLLTIVALGSVAYTYAGIMKEAVWALIGGVGLLPVMVTVLILILMESEALYHANQAKLPPRVVERFPNPDAKVIVEGKPAYYD